MTNPTPKQLAMARRIAADGYYPLREDRMLPTYARERVLSGDMDHTVQVQTVLAAIIETSERAAKMVGGGYRSVDPVETESPVQWNRRSIIAAIRKGDHLND